VSGKRPPAPPPAIEGYEYVSLLGSGGFSDVYLYQQDRPRRKVAVKVLLSDLKTEGARRRFESEANLMAQLSSHPYIVTIYEADITAEGHSYLAMEYCSRPSLDVRYRRSRLGVDEVLSVGIQVASAVETAHRAGIVHRDIKPANILVTDYNRPALTDFGISGTTDAIDDEAGLSIPWSPPEAFAGGSPDGVRMDVWSLGATLYTLLAGRSPFVRPGADNSQRELLNRIANSPLPPLNRPDVPASLELTLATAMSKNPGTRFRSAQQLALALQRVQSELGLSTTPFEVLDDSALSEEGDGQDDGEATRIRQVVSIDPEGNTGSTTSRRPRPGWDAHRGAGQADRPGEGLAGTTGPLGDTVLRPASGPGTDRAATGSQPAARAGAGTVADDDATIMRGRLPGGALAGERRQSFPASPGTVGGTTPEQAWVPPVPQGAPRPGGAPSESRQRFPTGIVAGIGAAVAVVAIGALVASSVMGGGAEESPDGAGPISQGPADPLLGAGGAVKPVEEFTQEVREGQVVFRWANPEPVDGDLYFWSTVTAMEEGENRKATEPTATTPLLDGEPTCIQVRVVRTTGKASEPARHCAPTE
jgi:eukaryotic-like serine/threonine-protein kinase